MKGKTDLKQPAQDKREWSVCVVAHKIMLSVAPGELFHTSAEVYECGSITALVNDPTGSIHLINNNSRNGRKDICNNALSKCLMEKYGASPPIQLSAWYDGNALLFGKKISKQQAQLGFSTERFTKIQTEEYEECTVRKRGAKLIISTEAAKRLGEKVSVYEHGPVMCIANDSDGRLATKIYRQDRRSKEIASEELIAHLKSKYPTMESNIFQAWLKAGRLYFAPAERPDGWDAELGRYKRLELSMSETCGMSLSKTGRLYISAQTMWALPKRVALYENGKVLAFKGDENGFRVLTNTSGAGGTIFSVDLTHELWKKYNCRKAMRFYTRRQGDIVFFSRLPFEGEETDFSRFQRLGVSDKKDCFVSVTKTGIYLSKRTTGNMLRRISIYRSGGILALVSDQMGGFKIANDNKVWALGLPGYINNSMGIREAELYAYPADAVIYVAPEPIELSRVKKLKFTKVEEHALKALEI